MSLLLDSHILLWYDKRDRRLREDIVAAIRPMETRVFISADTVGVVDQTVTRPASDRQVTDRSGTTKRFHSSANHATARERVETLPHLHSDPFDRRLIAQALVERLTLVTHDAVLLQYDVPLLRA